MIASGSARATASPTDAASSPSMIAGAAPSRRMCSARSGCRVVAVTVCPRSTSCRTSGVPIAPLPPATKTRIGSSGWCRTGDETAAASVTTCLVGPARRSGSTEVEPVAQHPSTHQSLDARRIVRHDDHRPRRRDVVQPSQLLGDRRAVLAPEIPGALLWLLALRLDTHRVPGDIAGEQELL